MMPQVEDLIGQSYSSIGRCLGLALEVYRRAGVTLADPQGDYPENGDGSRYILEHWPQQWLSVGKPTKTLDVIVMRSTLDAHLHCGVVCDLSPITMLHATEKLGVIRTPYAWIKRFVTGVYRHRELQTW
jgi:hypothetical protein